MQDVKQRLEKLRMDAEECQLISRLATNPAKQKTFQALADEYRMKSIQTLGVHRRTRPYQAEPGGAG